MAQAYTSVMKFTVDGRPYMKDVHDLFAALVTQTNLETHRHLFRSYEKTFTSEDAIKTLGSLQVSDSIRIPDLDDPSRLVTTVTTTTFDMERGVAKALCQQFLWSRLMFNAVDTSNRAFRDRGLWQLTPKGLVVLHNFCQRMQADHHLLQSPLDLHELVTLERYDDDQLVLHRQNMTALFRTLINGLSIEGNASQPVEDKKQLDSSRSDKESVIVRDRSYYSSSARNSISSIHSDTSSIDSSPSSSYSGSSTTESMATASTASTASSSSIRSSYQIMDDRLSQSAVSVRQHQEKSSAPVKKRLRVMFSTQLCCDWLVSYCTIASRDEAEIVTTQFLRHGWIDYQNEDQKLYQPDIEASKGTLVIITAKGRNLVLDTMKTTPISPAQKDLSSSPSALHSPTATSFASSTTTNINASLAVPATPSSPTSNISNVGMDNCQQQAVDGGSVRLTMILQDAQLRSLFTDFLRANFCAENLDFWIDYDSLRRKYKNQNPALSSHNQKDLLEDAYAIWSKYLSPDAKCELNVDHDLQQEMTRLVSSMVTVIPGDYAPTMVNTSSQSDSQCLRTMLKRLDLVENQICRLMSADSVPKFVIWLQSYQKKENIPGLADGIMMLKT